VLGLRDLQTSFFRSIAVAPGRSGVERFEAALVEVVEGRGALGPAARIDVYAQMYWARILDVLREDFGRVAAILGPERFDAVAGDYLARYPSTHPSLRYVGGRFPEFLAGEAEREGMPFLADLARFEWARLEVFDAPDAEPLRLDELREIPPAEWPDLTFRPIPAFLLVESAWPVQEIWATAGEGGLPEPPCPAHTLLRVWRDGFAVYHTAIDATERVALERVMAGEPFAAVCAAVEANAARGEAAGEAAALLLRWVEDGILARGSRR